MPRVVAVLAGVVFLGVLPVLQQQPRLSFFITGAGPGDGANLGGLAGADQHCHMLAEAVGSGDLQWRAYLSTVATASSPAAHARAICSIE